MPLASELKILTDSYFLAFGCCAECYLCPTLFPFSTVYICKEFIQLSCCCISASHDYQAPHIMPHPCSHAHELLVEPWSDFSLDPPLRDQFLLLSMKINYEENYILFCKRAFFDLLEGVASNNFSQFTDSHFTKVHL